MKNIILALILVMSSACKAQPFVVNLKNKGEVMSPTLHHYFKDIDNTLNPFVGEWVYTSGNTTLKIEFVKKTNKHTGYSYEDVLVGGYEYKVNNVTLVSTLSDINTNYSNLIDHKIVSFGLMNNDFYPVCNDCSVGEKRVIAMFSEPSSSLKGRLLIQKIIHHNQEAIKITLRSAGTKYYKQGTTPPPDDFVVPSGEYILIKQ